MIDVLLLLLGVALLDIVSFYTVIFPYVLIRFPLESPIAAPENYIDELLEL